MRMRPTDPLALVIAGAGIATAVLTGAWWIAGLGIVGWALVAYGSPPKTPPPTEPAEPVLGGAYADTATRLTALQTRITNAVDGATPVVRGCMSDLPGEVATLVGQCRGMLAKQAQLDQYLAEAEADHPQRDVERMAAAAATAGDPAVRERWQQAEAAARSRLEEMARIRTNRERTAADLAEVEARLKQVLSQVVAMDSIDQDRLTGISSDVRSSLSGLSQQVTVMQRVLQPEPTQEEDPPRPVGQAQ